MSRGRRAAAGRFQRELEESDLLRLRPISATAARLGVLPEREYEFRDGQIGAGLHGLPQHAAAVFFAIGATGFEPAASWSQTRRSTKLSYAPDAVDSQQLTPDAVYRGNTRRGKSGRAANVFDITQGRDNLDRNVIGSSSAKFGYWFSGYFTAAGHPAY